MHTLPLQVSANGEILDLKNTVNGMVLRLRTLAVEFVVVLLHRREGRQVPRLDSHSSRHSRRSWLSGRHRYRGRLRHTGTRS
jgi:hypothetical protein